MACHWSGHTFVEIMATISYICPGECDCVGLHILPVVIIDIFFNRDTEWCQKKSVSLVPTYLSAWFTWSSGWEWSLVWDCHCYPGCLALVPSWVILIFWSGTNMKTALERKWCNNFENVYSTTWVARSVSSIFWCHCFIVLSTYLNHCTLHMILHHRALFVHSKSFPSLWEEQSLGLCLSPKLPGNRWASKPTPEIQNF